MPEASSKKSIKITVNIRPGSSTPAMKTAWRKFLTRLVAECQRELAENEGKREQ